MIAMNRLLTPIIVLLFFVTIPTEAKNFPTEVRLEDTLAIARVRNSIITKGIEACKTKDYSLAIQLLSTFLNSKRVVVSDREIKGLSCLALAYQMVGEPTQATNTITRAISIANSKTIELANLEYTAGIIAERQNRKEIAVRHWEKARQLFLANNVTHKWAKITLDLAEQYRERGDIRKYRQLLEEHERAVAGNGI